MAGRAAMWWISLFVLHMICPFVPTLGIAENRDSTLA